MTKQYVVTRKDFIGKEWWGSLDPEGKDRRWSVKEDRIVFDTYEAARKVADEWNMMPVPTAIEEI